MKGGWCIAKTEGEYPVCKGTPGASEGGLVLVLKRNLDLIVPTKPIQKGEELLPRQGVKYLIDERQRKVIFLCSLV